MNRETKDSLNYAKYRTFCVLSEELIREYGRAAWMERADELYEKVKKKIMELPIAEAEQQMKQVDIFFQKILEGESVTVETTSAGPNTERKVKGQKAESSMGTKTKKKSAGTAKGTTEPKNPQRPRLKLTGTCPSCKEKTYLQFTDGYFCPDCNSFHITGEMNNIQKDMQNRMKNVLFDYRALPEKSIQEIKAMLFHDPHSAQLYRRLGMAYRQTGDNETAMKYYRKAAELDDRDGVIHSNMGVVYISQGNYYLAESAFEKAYDCFLKGDYTDWSPQVMFANYAIALHKNGKAQKAFTFLKKAQERGYENCETVFMDWGVGRELCCDKVCSMLHNPPFPYSSNLKRNNAAIQKVKKYFSIKDDNPIYYFFDYTVLGGCKEGLAVCADGIYFRMTPFKIKAIKWYELDQYEFSLLNEKNITAKKKEKNGTSSVVTMYFLQKQDGNNFLNVLWEMQKL